MPEQFLSNNALVKSLGNIQQTDESKINPHYTAAKDDVVDIIGKEKYDELVAADADDTDMMRVARAESYFVLSYCLPSLNLSSSGDGLKKATGFGDSRSENLSESEIQLIIERLRNSAERILSRYRLKKDTDEDGKADILTTAHVKFVGL
jgi:hypothetical protein